MDDILSLINNLSVVLKTSSLDIIKYLKLINSKTILLQNLRNEDTFNKLFNQPTITAQQQSITSPYTTSASTSSRKINLSSKLNNRCVYCIQLVKAILLNPKLKMKRMKFKSNTLKL